MRFEELLSLVGEQPFFDLPMIMQLTAQDRRGIRIQLSRWIKAGKILPLRRGMYALEVRYRRTPVNPAALANQLYRPSYLSTFWALGFYGMIPEKVTVHTSVTTRLPRSFNNAFGAYDYRHIKREAFFGYRSVTVDQQRILIADPEKALLDLWHLERGEWDFDRMAEMRFQSFGMISPARLKRYAAEFKSPRLLKTVDVWRRLKVSDREGAVEI